MSETVGVPVIIISSIVVGVTIGVLISKFNHSFKEEIIRKVSAYNIHDVQAAAAMVLSGYLSFRFNWRFMVGIIFPEITPDKQRYFTLLIMRNSARKGYENVGKISLYYYGFHVGIQDDDVRPPTLGRYFEYSDPNCFVDFANWFLHNCK